eukprot:gene12061-2652_t
MECEENNTLPNEEFPIHQLTKKEEASLDMMGNLFEKLAANSSTSSDQSEIHEFKKKLNRIVSNGTEPYELGFAKEPYDGKSQANFVEVFDSPIKLEIKNADKETLKVSIPPPSNQGKIQSCPSPFPKRPATENHSDVSAKRFCAVSPKLDLSDSPIARAFYAQRSKTFEEDYSVRIGVSAPLKVSLNMPRSSSLQPKFFSNNQLDFLESLADDSIVDKAYLDTVLSFSSSTVAPPQQVIQHILSNIAVSKNERISRKAITILNHLFSIRILSNRNFPLTWDFMCDLFDRLVSEAKIFTDSLRSGNLSNKPLYANCSQMFLHILNLLEQDFKRFAKNIRNTIVWKLVSPNVYGSARLRTVSQWFTAMFSIIEEMDGVSVESRTRLFSSLYVTKALQRLVSLIFLSNRNPEDFSQPIAEMYLNCFFEIRLIKLRKELLQSIENAMVQRKAVELILSTICEDSERSAENEIKRLSLESIVFCFFYKVPPRKCEQTESYCSQEEIEEFVFLLYLLVRSYLALNCGAHDSMSKLSILNPHEMDHAGHQLPLPDRETLLTINEQLSLLEDRLIGYVGHTKLESPTKMYLALLSRLLNDACESNGASAIRQGT